MKNDLVNETASVKAGLLEALDRFGDQTINTIPFEGSWTAGQVAEHVLMSASAMANALKGPVKPADRNPEQHVELLSQVFLNFEQKLKSPDFIIPSDAPKNKKVLMSALEEAFSSIEQSAAYGDLDMICTGIEMPTLGKLSKKELIWFTIVHTKRHIHQLRNIADHIEKQNVNETINN